MKSKIHVKTETEDIRFIANIRMKRDSAIWISLSPGFGIEAARGLVTKDSVLVIDKLHKEYDKRLISQLTTGFDFKFELSMIEGILLGDLMFPIQNRDDIKKTSGTYEISQDHGDISITNLIGAQSMKVEEVNAASDTSYNNLNVKYSNFQKLDDNVYPTEINVTANYMGKKDRSKKSANITIRHTKVEIDKKKYSFDFNIPSKYSRKTY
ncbi:MAG: DUF4292 domain-containing protein [Reichenbachiella sp.]